MEVYILEKMEFDEQGRLASTNCLAFESYWAANRYMYDDWIAEYDKRPDAPAKGEMYDPKIHDHGGFWSAQSAPSEDDLESEIVFRNMSKIRWEIFRRSVRELDSAWEDPGFDDPEGMDSDE